MATPANCIFCEIIKGNVKAYKVWEDKNYFAFLDHFPNIKGQTLVIPKKHTQSYLFNLPDKDVAGVNIAAKKVANLLSRKLKVGRIHIVFEGTTVNHLHAKLYPAIGIKSNKFKVIKSRERIYFRKYEGYVSTLLGPKTSDDRLKAVYKEIST